jgi:hypothetical protein
VSGHLYLVAVLNISQSVLQKLKEQALDPETKISLCPSVSVDSGITAQWTPPSVDVQSITPPADLQAFQAPLEISSTDNPELLLREDDNMLNHSPWASDYGSIDSWPTMLDGHYQRLDDVPSYANQAGTVDNNASWQSFMEQFDYV